VDGYKRYPLSSTARGQAGIIYSIMLTKSKASG
jgi:hypothetical protein